MGGLTPVSGGGGILCAFPTREKLTNCAHHKAAHTPQHHIQQTATTESRKQSVDDENSSLMFCHGRPARSTRHQTPISGHHWPSPGHRLKTPPDGGDLDRFRSIFFPTLNAHGLVVLACDLWVFSSNIHAGIQ